MKKIQKLSICLSLFLATYIAAAQNKGAFLRVYDTQNEKIYNGYLCSVTDSSLFLETRKMKVELYATIIGTIKMRRAFGHHFAIAGGLTAVSMVLYGAAVDSKNKDSEPTNPRLRWEGFPSATGFGIIFGIPAGAITGSIFSILARKRPEIKINNNPDNWKLAKVFLTPYLPKQ